MKSPIWFTLVLFSLLCSLWFTLVLFRPFNQLWSCSVYSVYIGLIRSILSTSVLYSWHWSYLVHYIHFGHNLSIRSYLVHFSPIRSTLFLFGPLLSICIHSGLFIPLWSFFLHLHIGKGYVWVESIYYIYIYIYQSNS